MRNAIFFLLILLLSSCDTDSTDEATPGPDQIVRLSDSEIKGLDPQKISDLSSLRVASDQFEGLTRLNAKGEAEPGLAATWTVSSDGLQWRFNLREHLVFSDRHPFDAALFAEIFDRLQQDEIAAPAKSLFSNIASVLASGERQVIVSLKSPAPSLPILLAHPAMAALPLHKINRLGSTWTSERPMTTSGAYRLSNWKLNDHARLERNPEWHEGPATTPTIIWKPMDSSLSGMRLFLAGGADIAADYPDSRHTWLTANHPNMTHSVPYLGSYYFAFNTRKPPFDDKRVRVALSMAVERKWIAEEVIGIGNLPAWSLLPPGLTEMEPLKPEWADWPRVKRLDAASKLLAEAGFGPDRPLKFEIRFNSSAEHRRVSVALSAMWKPLYVEASLFNSEAALHFSALRQHDFALARSGWIADIPTAENFLSVHQMSNGAGNYSGYDNSDYDALLSQAIATADSTARAKLMRKAETMLVEDAPILPLYFYVTRSLVANRITGWEDNISNVHPSHSLRIRVQ